MKRIFLMATACLCVYIAFSQPTTGLVSYWPLNGNFTNAGPNAINGTNSGATTTTNAAGTANSAINFSNPGAYNVVNQFATHPVNANVNFGTAQDFSVDFKVYITAPVVHPGGFYDNNLNYGGYGVWFWNANGFLQVQFNFKNGSVGTTNGALTTNTWYHICCVRATGTIKIYINGVLNASGAEGPTTPAYAFPARFGTMFSNTLTPAEYNGHNGIIDELRIYNRALTAAEISLLGSLPVKLTQFTAAKQNDNVLLQWKTAYEQNSSHFNVQRSLDGVNFTDIGSVNASGNTSLETTYQFIDNTAKTASMGKTILYRLKEVDKDGRNEISSVVTIKFSDNTGDLTIMQNPVTEELRLQLNVKSKQAVNLVVTDAVGKQVLAKNILLNPGQTATVLPVSTLANGVYYITASGEDIKETKYFIKQ